MKNISVILIPIGNVSRKALEWLAQQLKQRFASCSIGDRIDMPSGAYNGLRRQYMASIVIQSLVKAYPATQAKLLAVTDADLYAPGLQRVVGQAQGQCAVLSLKQLGAGEVLCDRIVKEAIHEIGHSMGLRHCLDSLCVMHYSRFVNEIDLKSDSFCKECEVKLCHACAEYAHIA